LSSQGAGAHLRRALTLLQGNHSTLPGKVPFVNSFGRTSPTRGPTWPQGAPTADLRAQHEALARRTSWWLPGTWPPTRPSPRGNKNFRGAQGLRQIQRGNPASTQDRDGTGLSPQPNVLKARFIPLGAPASSYRESPAPQRATPAPSASPSARWPVTTSARSSPAVSATTASTRSSATTSREPARPRKASG